MKKYFSTKRALRPGREPPQRTHVSSLSFESGPASASTRRYDALQFGHLNGVGGSVVMRSKFYARPDLAQGHGNLAPSQLNSFPAQLAQWTQPSSGRSWPGQFNSLSGGVPVSTALICPLVRVNLVVGSRQRGWTGGWLAWAGRPRPSRSPAQPSAQGLGRLIWRFFHSRIQFL